MSHAVQPPILDLKCKEYASWSKHPANFRKGVILKLATTQMMKHQDCNRRGKSRVRKWQGRGVALNHRGIRTMHSRAQLRRKCVVVFKTGHAIRGSPQLLRRRAWSCAQLQHVFAKQR